MARVAPALVSSRRTHRPPRPRLRLPLAAGAFIDKLRGEMTAALERVKPPRPPCVFEAMAILRLARADELDRAVAIDDNASTLFAEAGIVVDLPITHPFVRGEHARWAAAAAEGRLVFACAADGAAVGFASLGKIDGSAHLQQLSVCRAWMRQGFGRALVARARQWSAGSRLWLTTYAHLPWNGPYYESLGFEQVREEDCGPGLREILEEERSVLPEPERRVAMVAPPR